MKISFLLLTTVLVGASQLTAFAADWVTAPSRFTHNPHSGHRVWQFAPLPPVYHEPMLGRSAYRHTRSSVQVGDSADHFHVVEEYGHPVRPYGEWRFPYRPFSVPYDLWGPIGGAFGHGGFGGFGGFGGLGGGLGSPFGPFGVVNGAGFPPPWNDGSYPDVRRRQLPPQPFNPAFNATTNNINGNNNDPATTNNNNSPVNVIPGDNNNVINN